MAAVLVRRLSALRLARPLSVSLRVRAPQNCSFSSAAGLLRVSTATTLPSFPRAAAFTAPQSNILHRVSVLPTGLTIQPCRNVTYFSVKKAKGKSVKSVTQRFMRLHCGLWIRRKAGYKKKMWKKKIARRRRLKEIIFCNKTQSKLLDKMTCSYWKRRNWYVDDPYQKYHDRTNLKV